MAVTARPGKRVPRASRIPTPPPRHPLVNRDGHPVSVRDPGYPTLIDAVDGLTGRGFTEHFGVCRDGLRALDSGQMFRTQDLVIREYHRFEGVSDPDDMAICYAIETLDGVRGVLVDAFGVYSNPLVSTLLQHVPIRTAPVI
jgi:hypothetical protein